MKLLKLNTDHYVIVDDSEIKDENWYVCWETIDGVASNHEISNKPLHSYCIGAENYKKITHSTQPIEQYYGATDGTIPFVYHKIIELPLSEIKELIGEVDAEKKAEEVFPIISGGHPNINWDRANLQEGFVTGYNQALEDNKERKYTNEDMLTIRNQLVTMLPVGDVTAWDMIQAVSKYTKWFDEYIQSLQPKTEWEVEFIDGKLKLK